MYLKPKEYAKDLGVSVNKVRGWIDGGELNALNVGDKLKPIYRLRQSDVDAFEKSRSTNPAKQAKKGKPASQAVVADDRYGF